ncbi:MAG: SMC family ATPase, partial [Muribaculaceae bacterium]|nr:SMC family ATPase [Muribaculaceae bacterium]
MIIKNLVIHNIASIADAEIDFRNSALSDASIFLICGETGAGKTTILDSICLALYSQTPRMNSASREEISAKGDNKTTFYANDNAQLLRRGTGEGFVKLVFEGNDGKDYEATWAVQRDHKKPYKKLQKPRRALISLSDNSFNETHKREIEEKIAELTSLDYDQFCRTVMLAQGEFTKFLKSNRSEKSEILEKLTGTEIYSNIGRRIAAKFSKIKNDWENQQSAISQIKILTDEERSKLERQLKESEKFSARSGHFLADVDGAIRWWSDYETLKATISESRKRIDEIRSIVDSESFRQDNKTVADYGLTHAPRLWMTEIENVKIKETSQKTLQSQLILNIDKENIKIRNKEKEIEDVSTLIKSKHKEIDKCDIKSVNETLSELNRRKNLLIETEFKHKDLISKEKDLVDIEKEISENKTSKQELEEENKRLFLEKGKAELLKKAAVSAYESVINSTSKAATNLRSLLKEGEMCPVCGQKVVTVIDNSFFSEIVTPIKEKKLDAENFANEIEAKIIANNHILETTLEREKSLDAKLQEAKQLFKSEKEDFDNRLVELKIDFENDPEKLDCVVTHEKEIAEEKIQQYEKKQELYINLSGELNGLTEKETGLKNELTRIKDDLSKSMQTLAGVNASLKECQSRKEESKTKLDKYLRDNPEMSIKYLSSLMKITEKTIQKLETMIKETEDNFKKEKGGLSILEKEMLDKETAKPKLCKLNSVEILSLAKNELETKIRQVHIEQGTLKEQLTADSNNRKIFEEKMCRLKALLEEKEKWESLYKHLGDFDGNKFRAIAQSYILNYLLENANAYMRTFSNRYTLTCNPGSLAILVKDMLRPSDAQPASILSGGESFMASLSVALALSNLKGGGVGVDMLFIDEGFGTLSSDYLEKVMETLEKLHHIAARKVGLISQVAEMKAR